MPEPTAGQIGLLILSIALFAAGSGLSLARLRWDGGNKLRVADIYNHLAGIELQDEKFDEALALVGKAVEMAMQDGPNGEKFVPPAIFAHAEHLRGLVARRRGNLPQAAEHFSRSNEVAGQAGLGPLALDAGLAYGEALLAQREIEKARDVLRRVLQIAQALRNPVRERGATELLAQAEGREQWQQPFACRSAHHQREHDRERREQARERDRGGEPDHEALCGGTARDRPSPSQDATIMPRLSRPAVHMTKEPAGYGSCYVGSPHGAVRMMDENQRSSRCSTVRSLGERQGRSCPPRRSGSRRSPPVSGR